MYKAPGENPTVADELASLVEASPDGKLTPAEVVNYAEEHPLSALHSRFEWNNSKAAHCYRLWQARQLIATIHIPKVESKDPVRLYIHLRDEGEGYHSARRVCKSKDMFERLDKQFRDDIKALRKRYDVLKKFHKKLFDDIDEL